MSWYEMRSDFNHSQASACFVVGTGDFNQKCNTILCIGLNKQHQDPRQYSVKNTSNPLDQDSVALYCNSHGPTLHLQ